MKSNNFISSGNNQTSKCQRKVCAEWIPELIIVCLQLVMMSCVPSYKP